MTAAHPHRAINTALGMLSIVFWSTTIAVSRRLTESLGTLTAGALVYLLAGGAGIALLRARRGALSAALGLPKRYLLGCGAMFVIYTVLLYQAIGGAASRAQAIEVGIINYLWPSFTIALSVPLLGRRASWWLAPGIVAALAGVVLAQVPPGEFSWSQLRANATGNPQPYWLAFAAAAIWGAYSNLSRRWAGHQHDGAVPLFLAATGLVLLGLRIGTGEAPPRWSPGVAAALAYTALLPGLVAYLLYDLGTRRGHIIAVAAVSYFIPLLSTLFSCLTLGVAFRPGLGLSCSLLIVGAWLCHRSIREPAPG